jgi:hypothetical protein
MLLEAEVNENTKLFHTTNFIQNDEVVEKKSKPEPTVSNVTSRTSEKKAASVSSKINIDDL